jgi:hypothetical protein
MAAEAHGDRAGLVYQLIDQLVTANLLHQQPALDINDASTEVPTVPADQVWSMDAAFRQFARDMSGAIAAEPARTASLVRMVDSVL